MAQTLDADGARAWVGGFATEFRAAREELDDLDRQSGDGDFGSNLLSAIDRIESAISEQPDGDTGEVFTTVSKAFMHAGGTSGPLFGVWFRAFARSAAGGLDRDGLAQAVTSGLAAVVGLGQAQPGDKTMVDAIAPAADALTAAAAAAGELGDDVAQAATAARAGADATADLIARRGRASYVGEASRGVRDPGAVAVAMFFEAGVRSLAAGPPQ